MQLQVKCIDKSLPLPEYKTAGAVAFDLSARIDVEIKPQTIALIPLNIVVKIPKGYFLLLSPRSSLPLKKGLLIPNGTGIIDQDYYGPNDEICLQVLNFTRKKVKIIKGERIAQGLILPVQKISWREANKLVPKNRGGFGSTGN